jgi:hypothetical protein
MPAATDEETPGASADHPEEQRSPRRTWRALLFVLAGAAVGLLYQRLIGCSSGTCPITSSPYVSTLYGAVMGYLVSSAGVRSSRAAR